METSQLTEQTQIVQMSIGSIFTIAFSIVGTLAVAIGVLFRMLEKKHEALEKKNQVVIDLTKSFIETTSGMKTILENNTKVIEKLPEQIMLHIKSNKS